jgi:Fructose/tagatose bisphosphate aldolase
MLTTLRELLQEAEARNQAVGAFNVYNLESAQAVLQAAEALDAPVILATSEKALRYGGWQELGILLRTMAERARVPVALHLDHGSSVESVLLALRHGWSSVMLDGSHLPYEENVALTREAVRVAHAVGVSVEGELGEIAGIEDDRSVDAHRARLTDPEQARAFVKATGVDALAVAVGTSHGAYKYRGTPRLDLDRLAEIHARSGPPGAARRFRRAGSPGRGSPRPWHGDRRSPRCARCPAPGSRPPGHSQSQHGHRSASGLYGGGASVPAGPPRGV